MNVVLYTMLWIVLSYINIRLLWLDDSYKNSESNGDELLICFIPVLGTILVLLELLFNYIESKKE